MIEVKRIDKLKLVPKVILHDIRKEKQLGKDFVDLNIKNN